MPKNPRSRERFFERFEGSVRICIRCRFSSPQCLVSFPSKAQTVIHECALLNYSLGKAHRELSGIPVKLSTEVKSVVAKSADDYTCVVRNGYVDLRELPDHAESSSEAVMLFERSKRILPCQKHLYPSGQKCYQVQKANKSILFTTNNALFVKRNNTRGGGRGRCNKYLLRWY